MNSKGTTVFSVVPFEFTDQLPPQPQPEEKRWKAVARSTSVTMLSATKRGLAWLDNEIDKATESISPDSNG